MNFLDLLVELSKLNLNQLSDDDLKKFRAILNSQLAEADRILRCKQHYKTHHSSEKK